MAVEFQIVQTAQRKFFSLELSSIKYQDIVGIIFYRWKVPLCLFENEDYSSSVKLQKACF